MTTAALGGEFEVPTLDGGKTRVTVPEGTQTGKQFRLKGKGMPVLRSQPRRRPLHPDRVETPQNLTRRQRELLEEFEREARKNNSPNRPASSPASATSGKASAARVSRQ